jgi:GTP cyclohydrolase I
MSNVARLLGEGDDDQAIISQACKNILVAVGEDTQREGLIKTPQRFARAMAELTSGYSANLNEVVGDAIFNEDTSELVLVKNVEFYSLCEHHLLPFFGIAHVGYIPSGKIIGLSKIPRIVNHFSRRLQVQERLTTEIANTLYDILGAEGVGCVIEGKHMCMMMRGIQVQSSTMITHSFKGKLSTDVDRRNEFLEAVR